jgi:3-phenylpropionate/trans-cinnamate dioxygenase ferredoxin reductase subunit
MADKRSVVVVGAGLGGLRVCESLRQLGFDGQLTLIGAETHLPYDRPPLSKEVLKGTRANPPVLREIDDLRGLNIETRLGVEVVGLNLQSHQVRLGDGSEVPYDSLVIATGARPRPWPGDVGSPNVWCLRTADDARQIAEVISAGGPLAVLGAGFIGCEVAASARQMGSEVTLIELGATPLAHIVGPDAGGEIARRQRAQGVDVRCGVTIERLEYNADKRAVGALLTDGSTIELAGLVVGLGVVPNVEWLHDSGLLIEDGVVCDSHGHTSADGVFAVGDVACWTHLVSGRSQRVEHWTTTTQQAAIVAAQIAEGDHVRNGLDDVPYFWSDQFGVKLQAIGELSATADVTLVMAGPQGDRPLYLYSRNDQVIGLLGFGLPALIIRLKALISQGESRDNVLTAVLKSFPTAAVSALPAASVVAPSAAVPKS